MKNILFALFFFATPALAAFPDTEPGEVTARELLVACKAMVAEQEADLFAQGRCYATISTLMSVGTTMKRVCVPRDATVKQGVVIVNAFMEANPARLGSPFVELAVEALSDAWPCAK